MLILHKNTKNEAEYLVFENKMWKRKKDLFSGGGVLKG